MIPPSPRLPLPPMLDQTQTPILSALQASSQRPHAAFYAPGHKLGQGASPLLKELLGTQALRADLPELPELDNLFAPTGVIQQAQILAAEVFGADDSYFLANGSTCGIEAAMLAVCCPGDTIIVPRNAHRSVISGLILTGAMPVFVRPDYAPELGLVLGVSAASIAAALAAYPDARAVLVVSPTYHGIGADLTAIAAVTRTHQIPLLVDEAHGAHLGFHPDLPGSALAAGADLVVQSTHKLLAALSQASMLHCQGNRIDRERLQAALQLTQSSSPNALLLASLDAARQQMALAGRALMDQTLGLARRMRSQLAPISNLTVIAPGQIQRQPGNYVQDLTRLTLDVSGLGLTGWEADEILHTTLGVTAELPEWRHLTFIVSLGNTATDADQWLSGLTALSARTRTETGLSSRGDGLPPGLEGPQPAFSKPARSPRDAFFAAAETVPRPAAIGRLSADTLSAYPPGIPTIVAGEVISAPALAQLLTVQQQGGYITGSADPTLTSLRVITT